MSAELGSAHPKRPTSYKFVVSKGSCGQEAYDIGKCEKIANDMLKQGFELAQVYQSTTTGCTGPKSALIMVFAKTR